MNEMATKALPTIAGGSGGLARYLEEIRRFPMLEPNQEYMLAKRWREHDDTDAAQELITSHLASRGPHRHGLSRLWASHRRGYLRRQRRPDAGREALRARSRLPPGDLRHVVDPRLDPGIHPALVEPRQDGHDRGAEEAVLQPAARQEPAAGARGRRSQARARQDDRQKARRDRGRRRVDEPPPRRRCVAQRACARGSRIPANGRIGSSTTRPIRRSVSSRPRSSDFARTISRTRSRR